MKLFFFNGDLMDLSKNGSFTTASRELNIAANSMGLYADPQHADFIVYLDAFDVGRRWPGKITVPYLVSEYNLAPDFCIQTLRQDSPLCLAISQQAADSFINAGYGQNLIKTALLGTSVRKWPNFDILGKSTRRPDVGMIYLSHNTSNQRSGFEVLVPAFLEFAKGKNAKLIIKDQYNPAFAKILQEIDTEKKITYIGDNLSYEQVVHLYNQCHVHLYVNATTSFGMTIVDSAMAGLPQIVTNGSAIKEFVAPEHGLLAKSFSTPVDQITIARWNAFGLKNNLLDSSKFSGPLITERPDFHDLIEKLEFSYSNYPKLLDKNKLFTKWIKDNLTWDHSVKKIAKILKEHYNR